MKWFKPAPQGYDDESVAEIVVKKARAIGSGVRFEEAVPAEFILPSLLAVACSGDRVLDFGGGAAIQYLAACRAFPKRSFRWAIVEHPAMVRAARDMETHCLRFFASLEPALDWLGSVDLLHSNATLQYLDDPNAMLRRLLAVSPAWASWSRLLIGPQAAVEVQVAPLHAHGAGPLPDGVADRDVTHRITRMAEPAFLAAHAGYRIVWRSADGFLFERE